MEVAQFLELRVVERTRVQEPVVVGERVLGCLALQDRESVSQHQDLDRLLALTQRQQVNQGDRVRDGEVDQAQ
ncbi:hypothetical protein HEP84_11180 [Streptomyces sp. RLB1-33]|uniref:hypothetical protein n=1 Tax=Streptomyces mirabilis TaxID=68239 RepID=UPI00143E845D|nr:MULTISPECIES: hypothetical protein [Streptomyces]QIY69645.1 hypothetical protein HEP84_11180 [Streptomyces sp. RLB1-33]QUW83483.1 hypothetical protein SMIR_33585 [Streptomyces mirabilis]